MRTQITENPSLFLKTKRKGKLNEFFFFCFSVKFVSNSLDMTGGSYYLVHFESFYLPA